MAQINRQYGKHLSACSVGGQDIKFIVTDLSISPTYTTVDGTCLGDSEVYNISVRKDYRIRVTIAVDIESGVYNTRIAALFALIGTNVDYVITPYSGMSYGVSGSAGTGLLLNWEHNVPDGGQTISFDIIPNGSSGLTATG